VLSFELRLQLPFPLPLRHVVLLDLLAVLVLLFDLHVLVYLDVVEIRQTVRAVRRYPSLPREVAQYVVLLLEIYRNLIFSYTLLAQRVVIFPSL
jgi:hypothetical protein